MGHMYIDTPYTWNPTAVLKLFVMKSLLEAIIVYKGLSLVPLNHTTVSKPKNIIK